MDNESGETIEEEVIVIGRCELESERLVWGWRREDGGWFQRRGEAYQKERSVIRREDDVDGRAVWPKMKSVWWRCGKVERMERHRCVPFQLIMLPDLPLAHDNLVTLFIFLRVVGFRFMGMYRTDEQMYGWNAYWDLWYIQTERRRDRFATVQFESDHDDFNTSVHITIATLTPCKRSITFSTVYQLPGTVQAIQATSTCMCRLQSDQ